MAGALAWALTTNTFAQTNLEFTSVNATDEGAIQLHWASQSNHLYEVDEADALIDTNTGSITWNKLYDNYPSQGTNTFIGDFGNYDVTPTILHPKYMPMRFYRIKDQGEDSLASDEPTVSISSPTNSSLVYGELIITVTASTDQPILSGTKLYVDGQAMRPADTTTNWTDGATNYETDTYSINTCEWGNGTHTLFATAENESGFGDAINAPPVSTGHGVSAFIPVIFNNLVTRISFSQPTFDPSSRQTQQVSAVFPLNSDWTLSIVGIYSNVVQTATGSGNSLHYNWDGTSNGTNLANGIYYYYITAQTNGLANEVVTNSSSGGGGSPPSPNLATSSSFDSDNSELWALTADGNDAVPLAIYPVGFDTNNLTIFSATPAEVDAARTSDPSASSSSMDTVVTPDGIGDPGYVTPLPNPQPAPKTPQRPPNNPVRGLAGSFAIAYDTFTGSGTNGYYLNAPANKPFFPAIKIENGTGATFAALPSHKVEANNFVSEMAHWGWSKGFVKADDQLKLSDMQGGATPFNQVNLGVFLTHGTYGTTADYYANGCNQMYFPITSGTSAQWLRMSDMDFGGDGANGLRWMAIKGCHSLYHTDWDSMQYYGIYPYNSNLHLLLGADTDSFTSATLLQLWARYMNWGTSTNYSPQTIRAAWYQAAQDAYKNVKFPTGTVIKFVVAGDEACLDDSLQSYSSPDGNWIYGPPVTVFSN
jgi:hypothetical protein